MGKDANETPVVDLKLSGSSIKIDDIPDRDNVAKELNQALKKIGFVYLVNHGIPQEKIDQAMKIQQQFFNLPESIKRDKMYSIDSLFGYVDYGDRFLKRHGELEHRESYDTSMSECKYPTAIPDFKKVVGDLADDMVQLSLLLCQLIAQGLGLPLNTFADAHKRIYTEDNHSIFRMLHYPPMMNVEEEITRAGIHTDYDSLTLVFQDDVGGLKVKKGENEWIDAKPVPGAVLMNIGELLEIWSGGELKATEHCVCRPSDPLLLSRPRYSMIFFLITDHDALVEPLVGDKDMFEAVNGKDYVFKKLKRWYK